MPGAAGRPRQPTQRPSRRGPLRAHPGLSHPLLTFSPSKHKRAPPCCAGSGSAVRIVSKQLVTPRHIPAIPRGPVLTSRFAPPAYSTPRHASATHGDSHLPRQRHRSAASGRAPSGQSPTRARALSMSCLPAGCERHRHKRKLSCSSKAFCSAASSSGVDVGPDPATPQHGNSRC